MWKFLRLFTVYAPDEGAAAGEPPVVDTGTPGGVEAPPAGEGVPAAAPSEAESLRAMQDAAAARLLGETPPEELAPDGMVYRDAKELREQVTATRQQYAPIVEQLSHIPEPLRDTYLAFAPAHALTATDPTLGPDVGLIQALYPSMPPDDQAVVQSILGMANTDPASATAAIRQAAQLLLGGEEAPAGDGAPETDALGYAFDDPDRPITQAEIDQRIGEALSADRAERTHEAQVSQQLDSIQREMRDLGYDPASQDPIEQARAETLIGVARRMPNGDLKAAHDLLEARDQQIIDQYASGKRERAGRPQAPGGGAPPSGERVLVSLADSEQAMRERLAASGYPVKQ